MGSESRGAVGVRPTNTGAGSGVPAWERFPLTALLHRISWREMALSQADFTRLLQLRTGLRRFLRWSEQQAKAAGLTPAKHQLLLAIRGHPNPSGPTVGEIADYLLLRRRGAVGLIDRAATDGLVKRNSDPDNKSVVRVTLALCRHRQTRPALRSSPRGASPSRSHYASPVAGARQGRRPERPHRRTETVVLSPLPLDTART